MRAYLSLILGLALAGCSTHRQSATLASVPPVPLVPVAEATRAVETRYEVRSYREAGDPSVRHEAHAVYRRTRVPATDSAGVLETAPRERFAPASVAPLPASAELAAELAKQKEITGELQRIQIAMTGVEKQAQGQYATLVRQTAETVELRRQLEAERARLVEFQSKVREPDATAALPAAPAPVKW